MAFSSAPTDESFLHTAPFRDVQVFDIAKPAAEVWHDLTKDDTLSYCRAITSLRWTSARPFGVGTTRSIRVLGLLKIDERYINWEEGRRKTFVVEGCNLPLIKRLAEDYLVEPRGDNACTFTWSVALEPTTAGKPGMPLNKAIFASIFKDTRKFYA